MSGPDHRCPDCGVVDGCVCGPDDGPLVIPCLRPAGECRDAIAALTSELAEARRQLGEAVEVQEDLAGKLFDSVRERDALKARKHLSAWEHQSGRHWSSRKFNGGGDCLQVWLERGRWRWVAIDDSGDAFTEDDAKSAADRSVLNRSDGWWLEGGAHGAGEKP